MKKQIAFDRANGKLIQLAMAVLPLILCCSLAGCGAEKKSSASSMVVTAPAIQHFSEAIAGGSFIVEPGQYKSFKLAVAPGMSAARLEGNFEASGGGNDVEVLLLEATQFLNWQNGHHATPVYSSGRVTADRLAVTLPETATTYYLIFSNKFSYFRNKAVTANIKLQYDGTSSSDTSTR